MSHSKESCSECVARIGHRAPSWKATALLPNTEFQELSSRNFEKRWYVLFSYPLDFTFVCPTEIIAFSDACKSFNEIGCEVIGVSVDSQFTHLAWVNTPKKEGGLGPMKIPLLADLGGNICRSFGWMLESGHSLRGTAIVDDRGIVRHLSMNHPDVGRNIDEVLRLVKAFQYAAKHGEVCPAQWVEGGDTIKPDVKRSKEYFRKHK